jgi:hypothetical protein
LNSLGALQDRRRDAGGAVNGFPRLKTAILKAKIFVMDAREFAERISEK